jgi:N6-adenosine-specific RNA methylase IME4
MKQVAVSSTDQGGGKRRHQAKDVKRLVVEKRRVHRRKPDCVRERIERLVAGRTYLL